MDLRHLRHFVAVAQEMHFTRAARRLNIVQSALSASIAALERELGTRLFDRTTRRISLTPSGHALYDGALSALDAIRRAEEAVTEVAGLASGRLSIGAVQSSPEFLNLPAMLADFHRRYPRIRVSLRQGSRDQLVDQLLDGRIDLAFMRETPLPAALTVERVLDEPLMLACGSAHPLAHRREVAMLDLDGLEFVDFQPQWGTRSTIDTALDAVGIVRKTAFEVSDLASVLALVTRGVGVALVPRRSTEMAGLVLVPLAGVEIRWRMIAAQLRDGRGRRLSAAAGAFRELLPSIE